jgi:hypothetical protein
MGVSFTDFEEWEADSLSWIEPQIHVPLEVHENGTTFLHSPTKCVFVSDGKGWHMLTSGVGSRPEEYALHTKMPEELSGQESDIFLNEIRLMGINIYSAPKNPAFLIMDKGKIVAEYVRVASGGLLRSWPSRRRPYG